MTGHRRYPEPSGGPRSRQEEGPVGRGLNAGSIPAPANLMRVRSQPERDAYDERAGFTDRSAVPAPNKGPVAVPKGAVKPKAHAGLPPVRPYPFTGELRDLVEGRLRVIGEKVAAMNPVAIECPHGWDVCPTCDGPENHG